RGRVGDARRTTALTESQRLAIERADTLFIASVHADAGADASHRGGQPGFVRGLGERRLVSPDYAGNNMFQTLGNIAAPTRRSSRRPTRRRLQIDINRHQVARYGI